MMSRGQAIEAARKAYADQTVRDTGDECGCAACTNTTRTVPQAEVVSKPAPAAETPNLPNPLKEVWEAGLVWLINAAILQPRGYALAVKFECENPIGLLMLGDGSEPWCFAQEPSLPGSETPTYQSDDAYRRFAAAEIQREAKWSEKLS